MLKRLRIRDFALIEEAELEPNAGLSILTGESGAGKSLVLDALASVLGSKCNTTNIRSGAKKYSIEAVFDISKNSNAKDWLSANGIDYEENEIILKKELTLDGKSRVQMGRSITPPSLLREFSQHIAEVHRQNDQLFLLERQSQLEFLDRFAGSLPLRLEVAEAFRTYKTLKTRVNELRNSISEKEKRVELLEYQISEIEKASLKPEEESELSKEESLLLHGEKLSENYSIILSQLEEEEGNLLSGISRMLSSAGKITSINPDFSETRQELELIYEKLKELKRHVGEEKEDLFFSTERLDRVQSRLNEIDRLKKKYGQNISNILQAKQKFQAELEMLSDGTSHIESLDKEKKKAQDRLVSLSKELSSLRRSHIESLEKSIQKEFESLGMKDARLQIVMRWEELKEGDLVDGEKQYFVSENGLDEVDFYFSANLGEKPRPLRKIASGGELSRIMLVLRSVLKKGSDNKLLVFDEIDAGTSGEAAHNVALKLAELSHSNQIIIITHREQIAAVGNSHFKVEKISRAGRTITIVENLPEEKRAEEIAKMISGTNITRGAMEHARELLKQAV